MAWSELEGPSPFTRTRNIYVKRFDGTNWVNVGGGELSSDAFSQFRKSRLALDSSGNPVVAWHEGDGISENIYAERWDGTNWVYLGTTLDANNNQNAHNPSLALDSSGNPVVSWYESDGTSTNIYVKQWNGSSWVLVGSNPLDTSLGNNGYNPSLSLVNGSLAVAWQEGSVSFGSLYVKKYITNAWQDMGGLLDVNGGQSAVNSVITKKSSNLPVVAWDEVDGGNGSRNVYVKEWTGSNWNKLGTTNNGALDRTLGNDAENPSIAMRTDNKPTVAFQENNNVYVRRWTGTAWTNVSNLALDSVLANDALTPSIALDTTNLPVVAYAENGNILIKKANGVVAGSVWNSPFGTTALDTTLANETYRPSLALKTDNNPIVAWYEDVGTSFNIYAKEWNGTSWVPLGTTIDKTATRDAKDIVLVIRTDNRPVVAWEEVGNIYVKRWTGTSGFRWVVL